MKKSVYFIHLLLNSHLTNHRYSVVLFNFFLKTCLHLFEYGLHYKCSKRERKENKIMAKLTKTDCGELEFQLGYYTHYTAKTIARNNSGCEIALIYESVSGSTSCDFVIDLYCDEHGIDLLHTHEIRSSINIDVLNGINKAIETFNSLWVK